MPAYFLVGHSIELAMKAFLLGRGLSASKLRSKRYGHDLAALLVECRRRKLGIEVSMDRTEVEAVCLLNECYAAKEFEYRFTGVRRLPSYALVHAVATKLCEGLKPYVQRIGA